MYGMDGMDGWMDIFILVCYFMQINACKQILHKFLLLVGYLDGVNEGFNGFTGRFNPLKRHYGQFYLLRGSHVGLRGSFLLSLI